MNETTVQIKLVIFGIVDDSLVIYITNGKLPSKNIFKKTSLEEQVNGIFVKSLGFNIQTNYVEQLYTITNEKNEITIVYYILLALDDEKLKQNPNWQHFKNMQKNHLEYNIITYAVQRLRWKIEYTNVVYSLLAKSFTLSDLQKTYEAILGRPLDKRNFRKKIGSLDFLQSTGEKRTGVSRPAQMYSFKRQTPIMIKIFS